MKNLSGKKKIALLFKENEDRFLKWSEPSDHGTRIFRGVHPFI